MNGRGRPLRFVALVAAGWAGARVAILWPSGATLPEAIDAAFPVGLAAAVERHAPSRLSDPSPAMALQPSATRVAERSALPRPVPTMAVPGQREHATLSAFGILGFGVEQAVDAAAGARSPVAIAPVALPYAATPATGRWSASAWLVTRRGAPAGGAMLGGDQAGVRVAYALGTSRRLALYARAAAPLGSRGRELAIGAEWRPGPAPVRLIAEHRFALDDAPGGPTVALVGGVDQVMLPLDFRLEAYAQAGAVARRRIEPFADGAVRLIHAPPTPPTPRVAWGGGLWGAAQRGAARLDVGPSIVATLPVGESAVRLAVDWRERVAGDARPGSGPALTLGADF